MDFLHDIGFRASDSVPVIPQFISPIWELVSERNSGDDIDMEEGSKNKDGEKKGEEEEKEKKEGKGKGKGGEMKGEKKGKGEGKEKGEGKDEEGGEGVGGEESRESTHTASVLPSASYAQSFQGF